MSGGSCATRVLTSAGWAATSASAVTAPPLLANISTGPAPSALDDGVHVVRLDRGRMVDPAVLAGAAAEAARVIPDHGAVGEMRRQGGEATGVHGLTDHEQRWPSVGGGQRPIHVIGDVDLGGFKHVHGRHGSVTREARGCAWCRRLRSMCRAGSPAPTMPLCVLPSDGPRGRLVRPVRVPSQAARRPPGGRGDDDQTEVDDICGEPRKYPHGSVLSQMADGEPPPADRPLLDGPGSWVCRRSVCPLRTVPFVAQRTVVALGLLGARGLVDGQARGLPAMVPGLEPPSAQRRLGDAQLTRELGDGRAARAQPAHRLGPELRRVRRTRSWHRAVPSGRPRPRCPGLRVGQSLTPSIGQRQLAT